MGDPVLRDWTNEFARTGGPDKQRIPGGPTRDEGRTGAGTKDDIQKCGFSSFMIDGFLGSILVNQKSSPRLQEAAIFRTISVPIFGSILVAILGSIFAPPPGEGRKSRIGKNP